MSVGRGADLLQVCSSVRIKQFAAVLTAFLLVTAMFVPLVSLAGTGAGTVASASENSPSTNSVSPVQSPSNNTSVARKATAQKLLSQTSEHVSADEEKSFSEPIDRSLTLYRDNYVIRSIHAYEHDLDLLAELEDSIRLYNDSLYPKTAIRGDCYSAANFDCD